jgi:uncharacterized protein YyaL (SSP411 family)
MYNSFASTFSPSRGRHAPNYLVAMTELRSTLVDNKPTVYICRNFTCGLPIQTPEQLREKLL